MAESRKKSSTSEKPKPVSGSSAVKRKTPANTKAADTEKAGVEKSVAGATFSPKPEADKGADQTNYEVVSPPTPIDRTRKGSGIVGFLISLVIIAILAGGALTINASSDVSLSGRVKAEGGALTVDAGGSVSVEGLLPSGAYGFEAAGLQPLLRDLGQCRTREVVSDAAGNKKAQQDERQRRQEDFSIDLHRSYTKLGGRHWAAR